MTQLFDTTSYDDLDDIESAPTGRHLRSIPTSTDELTDRSTQWQLDDDTIETGRRGIALARQTLREAAKARSTQDRTETNPPTRKAA